MVSCTYESVLVSTELVPSSRKSMFVHFTKGRARHISCLCPSERFLHPSEIIVTEPDSEFGGSHFKEDDKGVA